MSKIKQREKLTRIGAGVCQMRNLDFKVKPRGAFNPSLLIWFCSGAIKLECFLDKDGYCVRVVKGKGAGDDILRVVVDTKLLTNHTFIEMTRNVISHHFGDII